jgi:hypothetical protein
MQNIEIDALFPLVSILVLQALVFRHLHVETPRKLSQVIVQDRKLELHICDARVALVWNTSFSHPLSSSLFDLNSVSVFMRIFQEQGLYRYS